jgi:nucleoside-diphosphate-sugar epimerase
MHVVVTGGGGYLGSVLCPHLLGFGHSVTVLDSLLYGGAPLLPVAGRHGFRLVQGDIRDGALLDSVLDGADAVVHLAAVVGDPACARDPHTAAEVNREGSLRLIAAAVAHQVKRFIFASTCSNYGRMADTSLFAEERHELRPVSLYAETKVAVEDQLLSADMGAICPVVYRFATLYGLSPRMRFDLTVNQFTMEMLTERKLTAFGEQFWRPYVHVRDAAHAIAIGLQAPEQAVRGEIFNIGSTAENYRKIDIIELIQERLTPKAKIDLIAQVEDPRDYRVSFAKAQRILGLSPRYNVRDGIEELIFALEHGIVHPAAATCYNVAGTNSGNGVGEGGETSSGPQRIERRRAHG